MTSSSEARNAAHGTRPRRTFPAPWRNAAGTRNEPGRNAGTERAERKARLRRRPLGARNVPAKAVS